MLAGNLSELQLSPDGAVDEQGEKTPHEKRESKKHDQYPPYDFSDDLQPAIIRRNEVSRCKLLTKAT